MRNLICLVLLASTLIGCSVKRVAVNTLGDMLADQGGGTFVSDDDPDLIREALPFGLKFYESLLEVSPNHRGLLLNLAQGFTAYAYLIDRNADSFEAKDLEGARYLRGRARNLYLRGRDYALRGLDAAHEEFTARLSQDVAATLADTTAGDAPYLYWAGAAWAGALSAAKGDLDLVAELPLAGAMMKRVLELDERYDLGAAHEFMIAFEAGRPGGSLERARWHYRRALELSQGRRASVYIAWAEAYAVRQQDLDEFRKLVNAALAVDQDQYTQFRLVNALARRRALWLRAREADLFLDVKVREGLT